MAGDDGLPADRLKALKRWLHGRAIGDVTDGLMDELEAEFGWIVRGSLMKLPVVGAVAGALFGRSAPEPELKTIGEPGILENPSGYGMIVCFNADCKSLLDPDIGKFCPRCGEAFEQEARDKVEVPLVNCPKCGHSVATAKFCEQCGASLADERERDYRKEIE